ncbi:MAG: hypothetical protein CMH32_01800 [Micavibrio sp.]|nr:hypothetical protein [Micavibrio sp.]
MKRQIMINSNMRDSMGCEETKKSQKLQPVILCGGFGKRLWPLSSQRRPKQFLPLFNGLSTFQMTIQRVQNAKKFKPPLCITHISLYKSLYAHIKHSDLTVSPCVLKEIKSKNTTSAILSAALYTQNKDMKKTPLLVMPSDHIIYGINEFERSLNHAHQILAENPKAIISLGITPSSAHTGYGYIEQGEAYIATSFKEKPDKKTAQNYLKKNNYLWNTGIFLCYADTLLKEAEKLCPDVVPSLKIDIQSNLIDNSKTRNIAFDIAIMEKTDKKHVVKANFSWSDIGGWPQLITQLSKNIVLKHVNSKRQNPC